MTVYQERLMFSTIQLQPVGTTSPHRSTAMRSLYDVGVFVRL